MNTKILVVALTFWVLLASCSDAVDTTVQSGQDAMNTTTEIVSDVTDSANEIADDMINEKTSDEGVMVGWAMMVESKDIVGNAVESTDHTTLVAAVQAAGLVDTLKSEGPFTVFAPTNAAFEKLPEGTVDTLLEEENKDDLVAVLTYHVVPGIFAAEDLSEGLRLETVQGNTIVFSYKDDMWYANNAKIEIANARSSNGITHVIDGVLTLNYEANETVPSEEVTEDSASDEDQISDEE